MAHPVQHYGRWRIRWLDEHGKRRSETFDDRKEAAFALRKREHEAEETRRGLRVATPADKTFNDLCDYWIEKRVPRKRSGKDDESIIKKHLRPSFGKMRLCDIGVEEADDFIADREALAEKTLSNHITLLISMLRLATSFKVPWLLTVPKFHKPKVTLFSRDYQWLRSEEEIKRFLVAARDEGEHVFVLYAMAIYTGMREGELAAIEWSDVAFDRRLITVQRSFEGPTKSDRVRYVPILDPLLPGLRSRSEVPDGFHQPRRWSQFEHLIGRMVARLGARSHPCRGRRTTMSVAKQTGRRGARQIQAPTKDQVRGAVLHLLELAMAYENRGTGIFEYSPDSATTMPTYEPGRPEDDPEALACLVEVIRVLEAHLGRQHALVKNVWVKKTVDALHPALDKTLTRGEFTRETIHKQEHKPIRVAAGAREVVEAGLRGQGLSPTGNAVTLATDPKTFEKDWDGAKHAAETVAGRLSGRSPRAVVGDVKKATDRSLFRTQWRQHVTEGAVLPYVDDLARCARSRRDQAGRCPPTEAVGPGHFELLSCADNFALDLTDDMYRTLVRALMLGEPFPFDRLRSELPNVPDEQLRPFIEAIETAMAQSTENAKDPAYREFASGHIEEVITSLRGHQSPAQIPHGRPDNKLT
jgi:integrase